MLWHRVDVERETRCAVAVEEIEADFNLSRGAVEFSLQRTGASAVRRFRQRRFKGEHRGQGRIAEELVKSTLGKAVSLFWTSVWFTARTIRSRQAPSSDEFCQYLYPK